MYTLRKLNLQTLISNILWCLNFFFRLGILNKLYSLIYCYYRDVIFTNSIIMDYLHTPQCFSLWFILVGKIKKLYNVFCNWHGFFSSATFKNHSNITFWLDLVNFLKFIEDLYLHLQDMKNWIFISFRLMKLKIQWEACIHGDRAGI